MNPKSIQEYRILSEEFENECYRVCKILEGRERKKHSEGHDIRFA